MFKQYIQQACTGITDANNVQRQRSVAVHITDFTSTKQLNLRNKEQTQRRLFTCMMYTRPKMFKYTRHTDSKDTTDPNVLDWKAKLQYIILISLAPNTLTFRTRNGINTK